MIAKQQSLTHLPPRDLRADLFRWLPELRRASVALGDARAVATSFETWDRLRTDRGLSRARTAAARATEV